MGLITRFDAGASPLSRIQDMKSFVIDYHEGGGRGEDALAGLVQSHPMVMLQLGILFLCALNSFLQVAVSSKFRAAMRKQSVVLAICSAILDIFALMNTVAGDNDIRKNPSVSSKASENPFASLMKGMVPPMSDHTDAKKDEGSATKNENEEGEIELNDVQLETIDSDYLSRARSDMKRMSKERLGQILAYAVIAFLCGSRENCIIPLLLRNFPFMVRGALLIIALVAPDVALPMVLHSKNHDRNDVDDHAMKVHSKKGHNQTKGRKKKSYRQKNRGKIELAGVDISTILFPVDLCAQGGDILQDCCDLLAWPLEQIILSGWMKQLTGSIFGRAGGNKTKKLFGIPVGTKTTESSRGKGSKMSKISESIPAKDVKDAVTGQPSVNIFQIGSFASKALCIYNYQRIRSKGVRQLQSLPRLLKLLNFPGAEALSAGLSGGQESNGNHTGSTTDSSGGDNDSKSMKPSSGGSHNENDDDDDGNGDGGQGVRALPSAKTRLSETPVPVTAAFQMAPGDVNGDVEPSLTPEKSSRHNKKRKKRRPVAKITTVEET